MLNDRLSACLVGFGEKWTLTNHDEEIRKQSSSGGIFTLLAEKIINEGGVVFGAKFDENWDVKHDYTETIEGLAAFRGSKYVQSRIEDNYRKAETFLKQGRKVLFCGTPCQIAGLKRFLRKEYENLLTIDFICHGVPSPGVWRRYLQETVARMCDKNSVSTDPISIKNARVESISFRDKSHGWKKFSFALTLSATSRSGVKNTVSLCEIFPQNTFMKGFLANLYLRPSCYACVVKCGKSDSDITIGDFWGIQYVLPKYDDDKGVSSLLINNEKVLKGLEKLSLFFQNSEYEMIHKYNSALSHSVPIPEKRKSFFLLNDSIYDRIHKLCKKSLRGKIRTIIVAFLKIVGIDVFVHKLIHK